MRKSEWSDKELEDLLRKMPKVKDHRDPRDIYQSLLTKANKNRRPVWFIPSLATAAAIIMFYLITPNIWNEITRDSNKGSVRDFAVESKSEEKIDLNKKANNELTTMDIAPNASKKQGTNDSQNQSMLAVSNVSAIYEDELNDNQVLTFNIPDTNAQILVPVSVIVPNQNESWLKLFNEYSAKLTEEQWGLSEYYPLNATLSMKDSVTLNVDVPEGHMYGNGSASETSFIRILEETLNNQNQIQQITLSTNGKPGIMLGNMGEQDKIKRTESKSHSYYLFNPNNQNLPFIVPSTTTFDDIKSALSSMVSDVEQYQLKASIPKTFIKNIDESSNDQLVVTLQENIELSDEQKNVYAIEAILLTAKGFGYKVVMFKNAPFDHLGKFDLQNPIKVPTAPNKVFVP